MFLEWQLKKQRLKHQKKLNDNNLCLYKSITFYINNSNLSKIEKEEILHQILDMMIEVQINNKNMDIIVGDNYEEFCETIISEYKYGKSKVYNILIYLQQYLIWFLITSLIIFSTNILTNNGNIGITINEIIIASAIALFIIPVVKKNKQKTSYIVDIRHKIATMNFNYTTVEIYALVCMFLFIILIKYILRKVLGSSALEYMILRTNIFIYIFTIVLIIGIIEVLKKFVKNS